MITKAEKKILDKYKSSFTTALYAQYTRNVPVSDQYLFQEIIEREIGKRYDVNPACDHCVLMLVGRMAQIYFKQYPEEKPTK